MNMAKDLKFISYVMMIYVLTIYLNMPYISFPFYQIVVEDYKLFNKFFSVNFPLKIFRKMKAKMVQFLGSLSTLSCSS